MPTSWCARHTLRNNVIAIYYSLFFLSSFPEKCLQQIAALLGKNTATYFKCVIMFNAVEQIIGAAERACFRVPLLRR